MSDFTDYARIAEHAADRLVKLKDETASHGWTKESKKTALHYFAAKRAEAVAMMVKTSPHLVRWAGLSLPAMIAITLGEGRTHFLPPDHRPLLDYLVEHGVTCFAEQPPTVHEVPVRFL
jgi:hypothetical protein